VVAAQLPQLSFDLRGVWEGQVRDLVAEKVEPSDLVLERRLGLLGEGVDEVPHRLEALRVPVVDGLEVAHGTRTLPPADRTRTPTSGAAPPVALENSIRRLACGFTRRGIR
jgi:hypothetical protein